MTRALRDTVFPKAGPGYRSSGCLDATSGPGLIPSRLRYSVIQQRGTVISNNIYETGVEGVYLVTRLCKLRSENARGRGMMSRPRVYRGGIHM
jgi:hypothetical protein